MHIFRDEAAFDSREVEDRLREIDDVIEALTDEIGDNEHPDDYVLEREELADLTAERDALVQFQESVGPRGRLHGITFIRDDYFIEYAREYAEDTKALPDPVEWPAMHIDWEAAARDLQAEYADVELDGVTWWYRA